MKSNELRTVVYDAQLHLEAYHFAGIVQPFPNHFHEHYVLGLSKSTLLRAFVQAKGVTPYRYLEAIRIQKAQQFLGHGLSPAEAALHTGFADQSHFTKTFSRFIGLTPGLYREIFIDTTKEEPSHGK